MTKIELGATQETLLIPLYGRAVLTREGRPPESHPTRPVDRVTS